MARNLACILGGPNPARRDKQAYSRLHYEYVCDKLGGADQFERYETIFIDSITVAARLCLQWAKGQPEAFSEKTGKPDLRSAYGLLASEMIGWATQLQYAGRRNIWFVGLLDQKRDDFNRPYYEPQIEGSKTGLELPGILDEVITMTEIIPQEGEPYRGFVCQRPNEWGFPAGDRSGKLNLIEPPHLGKLMTKIRQGAPKKINQYDYTAGAA